MKLKFDMVNLRDSIFSRDGSVFQYQTGISFIIYCSLIQFIRCEIP
jgi:hypothetical protein